MLFKVIVFICLSAQGYCASWRVNGVESSVSSTPSALTNEQDLVALRLHHYGSTAIVESPASWFQTDGAGTITNFLFESGRESVIIPWAINGVLTTNISTYAFTDLSDYDPGAEAFMGKAINSIIAPKTLKTLEEGAFRYCGALSYGTFPSVTSIGTSSFFYCTNLTLVSFPVLASLPDMAFVRCKRLASISLPAAITLGEECFLGCTNLTSVALPVATTIGRMAFNGCTKLASITIPSVTTIAEYAFEECASLSAVYFSGPAPSIGTGIYNSAGSGTNYVTNPTATGWGATFGGRPVVFSGVKADNNSVFGRSSIGPIIGVKQAYLTSNGTNLFFVNVNSQTNAITSN
jgi:hypothetical protein